MSARDHALIELDAKRLPGWKPNLVRRQSAPLSDARDLALSGHITAGVVKNLLLLQRHIVRFSGKSLAQIDPIVQKILAIGLYQLLFLSRIPPSAAVDQAVEQTKRFGRRQSSGFVNAVLRNATRQPPGEMPDRLADAEQYARIALSHPPELYRRLADLLGSERALAFCEHDNREPPTLVRLFDGVDIAALQTPGVEIGPHERAGMFVVTGARQSRLAQWARSGLAQVQDATAATVVEQLEILPGQIVVDRCAGLGTKTLQIQERVRPNGGVIAIDPSPARCELLRKLLAEREIANVSVFQTGQLSTIASRLPRPQFERIMADVPCSNSGVLARRPEARFSQDFAALKSLAKLQQAILDDSAGFVSQGGLLLYSTCSVWPEENEQLVAGWLSRHPEFKLLREFTTLPSFGTPDPRYYHDGGYFAVLRKSAK